jgi:putative transposase
MKEYIALKVHLKVDDKDIKYLRCNTGAKRFVYNWGLGLQKELYEERLEFFKENPDWPLDDYPYKSKYTCNELITKLPDLKVEHPWLNNCDSTSLQNALRDLDTAYKNFFSSCNGTRKGNKIKFPKFKKKVKCRNSFRINYVNKNIEIHGSQLKLPKLSWLQVSNGRRQLHRFDHLNPKIKSVTVSEDNRRWFASVLLEVKKVPAKYVSTNLTAGLDLGIKDFAVISNDNVSIKYELPTKIIRLRKRLEKLHREVSRKRNAAIKNNRELKDCKNYQKARTKLSNCYYKIKCIVEDFQHKASVEIVKNIDVLTIETLNIQGMMRNKRLAKAIQTQSWYKFVIKLDYKFTRENKILNKVDQFFPSTKTCHNCHSKNTSITLKDRDWICTTCNTHHDRDINASKVLNNVSKYILSTGKQLCTEEQYKVAMSI